MVNPLYNVYKQVDIISYARLAFDKGSISYETFEAIAKESLARMEAYQKAAKGEVTLDFIETEELKYDTENFMDIELIQSIIKEGFGNEEQVISGEWDYETFSNTAVLQVAFKSQYPDIKVTGYIDPTTETIFNEILNPENESLLEEDRPLSVGEKVIADIFGVPYGVGQSVVDIVQGTGELGAEIIIYTQFTPAARNIAEAAHLAGWMDDQKYRHFIDYLDKDQQQREEMFLSLRDNILQGIKQDALNTLNLPKDLFDPTKDINDIALTTKSAVNTGTLIYGGAKGFKTASPKVFKALVITKEGVGKLLKTEGVLNLRAKFKDVAVKNDGYIRLQRSVGEGTSKTGSTALTVYDPKFAAQQLLKGGKIPLENLENMIPNGAANGFKPSATIADGYKYNYAINGTKIEIKWHAPDANTAAKFPGSNSGSGWTAQIKIGNKLLGQDGNFYKIPSNITHIPVEGIK